MVQRTLLNRLPTELVCQICEYLTVTHLNALEVAYDHGPVHDVARHYIFGRGLTLTRNPLHDLVTIQRADCLDHLATRGEFDVNATDDYRRTALHIAAAFGLLTVARSLLQFPGINLEARDRYSQSPLFVAITNRQLGMVELLLREGAVHRKALRLAIKFGYLDLVKLLVSMDHIDVNETNDDNSTPLLLAVRGGRAAIVRELLLRGNVDVRSRERKTRCTPLLMAASLGNTTMLLLLLAHDGVNIHDADREKRTALSLAADKGHLNIVRLLLSRGVDPHRVDRSGRTCLHYSVQREHEQVSRLLLRSGCDCQLRDSAGMSPLRLAVKANHNALVDEMLAVDQSVDYGGLLMAAAEYSNIWVARKALAHVSPNIVRNGATPLLSSTKRPFFRYLLGDKRIDVNQSDKFGTTPLIYAVERNWVSIVGTLLARDGLNVEHVDRSEQSACDHAKALDFGGCEKLLSNYLLKSQVSIKRRRLAPRTVEPMLCQYWLP